MHEILSDSECSETEDVQASIIMALSDMFTFSQHVMSDGLKFHFNNGRSFYQILRVLKKNKKRINILSAFTKIYYNSKFSDSLVD